MKKYIIKRAFTLAEVLLVVVIIGVVAALAVPNLNKDINEEKYISLLKGTMSQVNTAIASVIAQYGSIESASRINCPSGTLAGNTSCFAPKIVDKMDVSLNCQMTVDNCITKSTTNIDNTTSDLGCDYAFMLSNGVSVCFSAEDVNSNHFVYLDLDGAKNGYNKKGADKFVFKLTNDGLEFLTGDERTYDAAFRKSVDESAWAFYVGNMDYLKCYESLKWQTKETCD